MPRAASATSTSARPPMLPPLPCDQTSVAAASGAPAHQASRLSPSAVVIARSSTPGGRSGTAGSGKKISRSSGTQVHPAASVATTTTSRLEIPARLLVAGRLLLAALDPLPGDHALVAHAGRDHRVDVRRLVDHHLEEGGAGEADELFEVLRDVGDLGHPPREQEAVGLDRLHEILLVERLVRARVAVRVEEMLPLADHAVAQVVQEQHLHRDVVGGEGLELAQVHADRAVAVDVDDEPARVGELRADGGGEPEAHG